MKDSRALRTHALQIKMKDGLSTPLAEKPQISEESLIKAPKRPAPRHDGESQSYKALKASLSNQDLKRSDDKDFLTPKTIKTACIFLTGLWVLGMGIYGIFNAAQTAMSPISVTLLITAMFTPPALLWSMVAVFLTPPKTMTTEMAAVPEAIDAYTKTFEDVLARGRMVVQKTLFELQEQEDIMNSAVERIETQARSINELSQQNLKTTEKTIDLLEAQAQSMDIRFTDKEAALNTISERILREVKNVEKSGLNAAARLEKTLNLAKNETQELTTALSAVINKFDQTTDSAQNQIQSMIERTGEHVLNLGKVGQEYQQNIDDFHTALIEKAQYLKSLDNFFHKPLRDLETTIADIEKRYQAIETKMRAVNTQVNATRSDVIKDVEHSRTQALKQIDVLKDLSACVHESLSGLNIKQAIDQLQRLTHIISDSEQMFTTLETAAQSAHKETYNLRQSTKSTVKEVETFSAQTKKSVQDLLDDAEHRLASVYKGGQAAAAQALDATKILETTLAQSTKLGETIIANINQLTKASDTVNTTLTRNSETLQSHVDAISTAGTLAVQKLDTASNKLTEKTQSFMDVSSAALNAAYDAGDRFKKHSQTLLKSAEEAYEITKDVQENILRTRQQEAVESAEFVLEALHSLSVDLMRLTNGGVSEKQWKAYQSGQRSVFTEAMVSLLDDIPQTELFKKFKEDSEFRTSVLRFIKRFEDFWDDLNKKHAQKRGASSSTLLQETIGSSMVAKLYTGLCTIADHSCILD